jgi:hypothetical protein
MTHSKIYPGSDVTTQWRGAGGTTMPTVNKLLLHTTESSGWPAYPTFEPTLTYHPFKPRGQRWRQHHPINGSASTLANAGAHRTNRDNVCQIEIVAYCDPAKLSSTAHISKISVDAYDELGEFFGWIHREWEVPLKAAPFKAYPGSYGIHNGVRMSVSQFVAYEGLCGHQHAPEQSHGDPGDIDIQAILEAAKGGQPPVGYPTPKTNDVYLSRLHLGQQNSDSVWWLQKALQALGATIGRTGDMDKTSYEAWAQELFDAADVQVQIHNDL